MKELLLTHLKTHIHGPRVHHAYCVGGKREEIVPVLVAHIEQVFGIKAQANPDFSIEQYDSMGIEESRQLKERQTNAAIGKSGKKIFVISFQSITHEAQNSLLKAFEEPTEGTHFFLITPAPHTLLPTLRSRLAIISPEHFVAGDENGATDGLAPDTFLFAQTFLKSAAPARLTLLADIIENKDKQALSALCDGIEVIVRAQADLFEKNHTTAHALTDLMKMRSYLHDRSSSVKMIAEFLAVTLPQL